MHQNAAMIETFYGAFQHRDAAAMGACYLPEASFRDPVFRLRGWRARAMWTMLCERGTGLRIEFRDIRADQHTGSASWEAWYTFSATGRPVHNRVRASFRFESGRIIEHRDNFNLWRWAGQALGPRGWILGWAPPVRQAIRRRAARALERFIEQRGIGEAS